MGAKLYSDSAIAEALGSSNSIREAARKIGMAVTPLERRCRQEGLNRLYEACAERGKLQRGVNLKKTKRELPMFAVVLLWRQPCGALVDDRVWTVQAEDEKQALEVARHITGRIDGLSVLREVGKR